MMKFNRRAFLGGTAAIAVSSSIPWPMDILAPIVPKAGEMIFAGDAVVFRLGVYMRAIAQAEDYIVGIATQNAKAREKVDIWREPSVGCPSQEN